MDATFLLEVSAVVAVVFELVKRLIALKVTNPVTQDWLFRGLLIAIAFVVASANYFYFAGHPEIVKTATQIAIQASGIWALIIKLLPKSTPTGTADRDAA